MQENSYLNPNTMKGQCNAAIKLLQEDIENLVVVTNNIGQFCENKELEGEAFTAVKEHMRGYLTVVSGMYASCEGDICDYERLTEKVGEEILDGEKILKGQRKAQRGKEDAEEKAEEYKNRATTVYVDPTLYQYYVQMSSNYEYLAENYQEEYEYWVEKEDKYDRINSETTDPLSTSYYMKEQIAAALEELSRAYNGVTFTNTAGSSWRTEINEEISMMAIRMTLGKINGEAINEAEIARLCKKDFNQMTPLELAEWNAVVNYLKDCDIGIKKNTRLVNLILKNCTEQDGWIGGDAYKYKYNEKIGDITVQLGNDLKNGVTENSATNYILWSTLYGMSLNGNTMHKVPEIEYMIMENPEEDGSDKIKIKAAPDIDNNNKEGNPEIIEQDFIICKAVKGYDSTVRNNVAYIAKGKSRNGLDEAKVGSIMYTALSLATGSASPLAGAGVSVLGGADGISSLDKQQKQFDNIIDNQKDVNNALDDYAPEGSYMVVVGGQGIVIDAAWIDDSNTVHFVME